MKTPTTKQKQQEQKQQKQKEQNQKESSLERQKGQEAQQLIKLSSSVGAARHQPQEEGLYKMVKQDTLLRSYHAARLRSTSGYESLTEEEAGDMVEQMLRLVTLTYEMLIEEQDRPCQGNFSLGMAA